MSALDRLREAAQKVEEQKNARASSVQQSSLSGAKERLTAMARMVEEDNNLRAAETAAQRGKLVATQETTMTPARLPTVGEIMAVAGRGVDTATLPEVGTQLQQIRQAMEDQAAQRPAGVLPSGQRLGVSTSQIKPSEESKSTAWDQVTSTDWLTLGREMTVETARDRGEQLLQSAGERSGTAAGPVKLDWMGAAAQRQSAKEQIEERLAQLEQRRKEIQQERETLAALESAGLNGQALERLGVDTSHYTYASSAQANEDIRAIEEIERELKVELRNLNDQTTRVNMEAGVRQSDVTAGVQANVNGLAGFDITDGTERDRAEYIQAQRGGSEQFTKPEDMRWVNAMSQREQDTVLAYLGRGDWDGALKYLEALEEPVNQRLAEDQYQEMGNVGKALYWVPGGLDQFFSGLSQIGKADPEPQSVTGRVSQMVREDAYEASTALGFAYDLGTSVSNMAPSILLSVATYGFLSGLGVAGGAAAAAGSGTGAAALGSSAGGNAYAEKRREGFDSGEAAAYAMLVGASEGALQYALGGISKLGITPAAKVAGKIAKIDNAFGKVALELGSNMISEGTEEALQSILEPAFATLLLNEEYEVNFEEVATSFLMGAITAGLLEGPGAVRGGIQQNRINKNEGGFNPAMDGYLGADGVDYFRGVTNQEELDSGLETLSDYYGLTTDRASATVRDDVARQYMMRRAWMEGQEMARQQTGQETERTQETQQSQATGEPETVGAAEVQQIGRTAAQTQQSDQTAAPVQQASPVDGQVERGIVPTVDGIQQSREAENSQTPGQSQAVEGVAWQGSPGTLGETDTVQKGSETARAQAFQADRQEGAVTYGQDTGTEPGAGVSDGGPGWDYGASTSQQDGGMGRSAAESQAAVQSRAAISRRHRGAALQGQEVSSIDLGLTMGTGNKSVLVYPREMWDQELVDIAQEVEERTGVGVTYVLGNIQVRRPGGSVAQVRGVYTGSQIILQADHNRYSVEQLARHEEFHNFAARNQEMMRTAVDRVMEKYSPEELERVVQSYIQNLRGIVDVSEYATADEMAEARNRVMEEVLADAYGGINAFGEQASRYQDTVTEVVQEWEGAAAPSRETAQATQQTTGPTKQVSESAQGMTEAEQERAKNVGTADDMRRQLSEAYDRGEITEEQYDAALDDIYEWESLNDVSMLERYSVEEAESDSKGRKLSEEQKNFFRQSVIRDENGRLKVLYHGTPDGWDTGSKGYGSENYLEQDEYPFTVFESGTTSGRTSRRENDPSAGIWMTSDRYAAKAYAEGGGVFELYADIRDPLDATKDDGAQELADYINENTVDVYGVDPGVKKDDVLEGVLGISEKMERFGLDYHQAINGIIEEMSDGRDWRDGLLINDIDRGDIYVSVVAVRPEQVKTVWNVAPTEDSDIRYSVDSQEERIRDTLPAKARTYLHRAESNLVRNLGKALSVPTGVQRNDLMGLAESISEEHLQTGTVRQETIDRLFDEAYAQGVVVEQEMLDQYRDLYDRLRSTKLVLGKEYHSDTPDFEYFRKAYFGRLNIGTKGKTNIDQVYQELAMSWPQFFNEREHHHPADQLEHIAQVMDYFRKVERDLDSHYGPDAEFFRQAAHHDFQVAIEDIMGELRNVRRYSDDRTRQAEQVPELKEEDLAETWDKLKDARKKYDKAKDRELLTDEDKVQLGRVLRGEDTLDNLNREKYNVDGIRAVYDQAMEYEQLSKALARWNRSRKEGLRTKAASWLETAIDWKDKKMGILYSRETMERNIRDIVPDKALAEEIIEAYFTPVHQAVAEATKMKNAYRDRVRALDLSRKVRKGNLVSESHAVQLLGEAEDNIRVLERSRGRMKDRDGKTLEEWRAVVRELWETSPSLDQAKIRNAVQEFRAIYDELFQLMNEVRIRNGYEPVNYRQGYFPHFQPGNEDGILAAFGRAMGVDTEVTALPTTINGLTHTFKPGIRWMGNAQERLGFNTAYDAVQGFDRYIEGVADVVHLTDSIQNLRALASEIRYRTGTDGIRQQVDAVRESTSIAEEDKQNRIEKIYESGRYSLSNFVVELEEYTNLLANKKSRADRNMEQAMGRKMYNRMKALESRVAANMVAVNPASWLTNFIPLTQGGALLDRGMLLHGMWDTLRAYKSGDGFVERSTFLTNRRGSDPLVRTWAQQASATMSRPMEYIDQFTADSLVRARYRQNVKKGMSEAAAMEEADAWTAGVMADRSKGSMPTLFHRSNPITKVFTQFQLEVNNQLSYLFKDMPRDTKEKGLGALAVALFKFAIGAFLYNEVYEYIIGRRPALDPIGILNDSVGDLTGWELPNLVSLGAGAAAGDTPELEDFQTERGSLYEVGIGLGENVAESMPFVGGLLGGGRLPIGNALPDFGLLWQAMTDNEWSLEKRGATALEELGNPATYLALPFGGGQMKKIYQAVRAAIEGGRYKTNSDGEKYLQYPMFTDTPMEAVGNTARAALFGMTTLPTGQEWINSGFRSFSVKETAAYQGMLEVGVTGRDAYDLIRQLREATETEEESKTQQKRRMIQESDISDDGKAVLYYSVVASDREREIMDELDDRGADTGSVLEALMGLKELGSVTMEGAERVIRSAPGLTNEQRAVIWQMCNKSWVSKNNPFSTRVGEQIKVELGEVEGQEWQEED